MTPRLQLFCDNANCPLGALRMIQREIDTLGGNTVNAGHCSSCHDLLYWKPTNRTLAEHLQGESGSHDV